MSLNTAPLENDIVERVRSVIPRVWVSEIPDDVQTPGYPYAIVYFGGPIRSARDHHMTSSRNDTNIGYCTVQIISTTDASARDVNDRVRNSLVGYTPTDCGEMVLEGGIARSNGSTAVKPTKFYRESGYSYMTNLSWVD